MIDESPLAPARLFGARDAAKAYLRIDGAADDAVIDQLVASAVGLAEAFTAQRLVQRSFTETIPVARNWTRLSTTPVRAVTGVVALGPAGAAALTSARYDVDIDAGGDGWVRMPDPAGATQLRVTLTAGLAEDWAGLPEPVRLGILRLAAHFFAHRDAADDPGPPAAVAALLRPWRRMRIR